MVEERVKPMIINGVYGNGNLKTQEMTGTVPKEVENTAAKNNINSETIPAIVDTGFITYDEDSISKKTEDNPKAEDIPEEEQLDNTSGRLSKEDCQSLSEEGISLEEYNIERLDRALQRIKTQRTVKEENLDDQKENFDKKIKAVENMADYNGVNQKIIQKLIDSDLPVTEANIEKIATAMDMASSALQFSDKAMNYLIKNNMEPTIKNIYKAQYSGNYSQKKEITDEVFTSLQGQVNEIVNNAGLEVNDENTKSAKWLLNHQLPLTEDTLWAYRDLKLIKDNITAETVLDKTVEAFASGKSPDSASLGLAASEQAGIAISAFQSISDEAIQEAVKKQSNGTDQINCRELQEVQRQLDRQDKTKEDTQLQYQDVTNQEDSNESEHNLDIQTITVRRQLEEIRLKMTLEAGQQLIRKGFHLDTDSLSKIVDGLKEMEDQYYKNLLKEGNTEAGTDNVEVLKSSIQGMEELKGMPSYILGSTLSSRNIESVNGLLAAGSDCRQSLDKAGEAYETLMTRPRSDMGDSITKAFRNVDAILDDLKLEPTQANERAVRILGYNGIEITNETIQHVKSYDEQVNQLMKNFQPAVVVELIKNGTNPINMSIEELNQQIGGIKSELGIQEEEKYSKYLWKLEKNKSITEDEKKSYIGIYRLLNAVEKTDGAALGMVLKADQDVTMNNLLTAVRTIKSGGVDTAVDDSFGSLTQITYTRENITEQVNASFKQTNLQDNKDEITDNLAEKFNYINNLLKDVREEITPDKLQTLGDSGEILNMSVEKLQEEILNTTENADTENNYWGQKLENYHEIIGESDKAIKLLQNYDLPTSLNNIQAAKDVLSKDQTFYKQLSKMLKSSRGNTGETKKPDMEQDPVELPDISEGFIEALTGTDNMKAQYQTMEQDVNGLLNQLYANPVITSQDIATLQRINYGMSFIQKLASKESYEIPLTVGDKITNVNVTIIRNTGETGKVNINIDSDALGKISVGLSVKEQGVNALITCDNRAGLTELVNKSQELKEAVTQTGTEIKQLNYGIGNKTSDSYRYNNYNSVNETQKDDYSDKTNVTTDTLYSLAKTFLVHIKEIETNFK